jgi:hypothetical protein
MDVTPSALARRHKLARSLRGTFPGDGRKTFARRTRRDPREELTRLAATAKDDWLVRVVFRLPRSLEGFIAPGPHGIGITVLSRGYVRIGSDASDKCFQRVREFCATVARDRAAFTSLAVVIRQDDATRTYARWLSVTRGALVVSTGHVEPRIYDA